MLAEYKASPRDLSDIALPAELDGLKESLAEHTHEIWVASKLAQGYRFGEVTSDEMKTHRDLVPYSQLPDDRKKYDRDTSLNAIKFIVANGFMIKACGASQPPQAAERGPAGKRRQSHAVRNQAFQPWSTNRDSLAGFQLPRWIYELMQKARTLKSVRGFVVFFVLMAVLESWLYLESGFRFSSLDILNWVKIHTFNGDSEYESKVGQNLLILPIIYLSSLLVLGLGVWNYITSRLVEKIRGQYLQSLRGHIVIIGLGRKGRSIAEGFFLDRSSSRKIVCIEKDDLNDNIAPLRDKGAQILLGSGTDPDMLAKARAMDASQIFCVMQSEQDNALAAFLVEALLGRKDKPAKCSVPKVYYHGTNDDQDILIQDKPRIARVNLYDSAARQFFLPLPKSEPDDAGSGYYKYLYPVGGPTYPARVVFCGMGNIGRSLLRELMGCWDFTSQRPLSLFVLDNSGERPVELERLGRLAGYLPEKSLSEPIVLHEDDALQVPTWLSKIGGFDTNFQNHFFISLGKDVDSMACAKSLGEILRQRSSGGGCGTYRITVFLLNDFPKLISFFGQEENIECFQIHKSGCDLQALTAGNYMDQARRAYQVYLRTRDSSADLSDDKWAATSQQDIQSSISFVRHCGLKRHVYHDSKSFQEHACRMEHHRWLCERVFQGWEQADHNDSADATLKRKCTLRSWEGLDENCSNDQQAIEYTNQMIHEMDWIENGKR